MTRSVGRYCACVQHGLSCPDHRHATEARGPARHDPDDPVPRAHGGAQRDPAVEPLVRPPGGGPLPDVGQVRVLRGPQRGRALRLEPAVQVPHRRQGRRGVPRRDPRPRHPGVPARPRPVHVLARRPRLRHRGRGHPPRRARTSTSSPRPSRTSRTSRTASAGWTSRSRRSATASGRSPSRGRARATCSPDSCRRWRHPLLRGRQGRDRRRGRDRQPDRL